MTVALDLRTPPSSGRLDERSSLRRSRPSPQATAKRLVADYLRDWGLRDPELVAAEAKRIVEATLDEMPLYDDTTEAERDAFCQAAIRRTVAEIESWSATIARGITPRAAGRFAMGGTLSPGLSELLDAFPEAIVRRDHPTARALADLERAILPVVPKPNVREMGAVPRTRAVRYLRPGFWKAVARNLGMRRRELSVPSRS